MKISVMVTLNENYLPYLKVMLMSLRINNPDIIADLYVVHKNISDSKIDMLQNFCSKINYRVIPIKVNDKMFSGAPVTKRYPEEMYYRLLAHELLPMYLDKVLYLDPDILVINSVGTLWNLELQDKLFAAASHTSRTDVANSFNHIRLGTHKAYYNSGVLLINLQQCRKRISAEDIYKFVKQKGNELILPDQDILNALYENDILPLEDCLWNYDARNYHTYLVKSGGEYDIDWIMRHTSILHFCGKEKPWKKNYRYRFGYLYKHYENLCERRSE